MTKMISARDALSRSKSNEYDRWVSAKNSAKARLDRRVCVPVGTMTFTCNSCDTFFAMGSCFARNVEERLRSAGTEVLSCNVQINNLGSRSARLGGIFNKYTPHSILQELQWASGEAEFTAEMLLLIGDGLYYDPHLRLNAAPGTREALLQRRTEIREYFQQVFTADVVILTLGLIESWYDYETGVYLNEAPDPKVLSKQSGRFGFTCLSVEECKEVLYRIHRLLCRHGGQGQRIVLTVSPVPLGRTFSGTDIVVANTTSKSTLRVAATDFVANRDGVDYFPSYEAVMLSHPDIAWQPDRLHASDFIVGRIIDTFLYRYGVVSKMHEAVDESNDDLSRDRLIAQLNRDVNLYKNQIIRLESELRELRYLVANQKSESTTSEFR